MSWPLPISVLFCIKFYPKPSLYELYSLKINLFLPLRNDVGPMSVFFGASIHKVGRQESRQRFFFLPLVTLPSQPSSDRGPHCSPNSTGIFFPSSSILRLLVMGPYTPALFFSRPTASISLFPSTYSNPLGNLLDRRHMKYKEAVRFVKPTATPTPIPIAPFWFKPVLEVEGVTGVNDTAAAESMALVGVVELVLRARKPTDEDLVGGNSVVALGVVVVTPEPVRVVTAAAIPRKNTLDEVSQHWALVLEFSP